MMPSVTPTTSAASQSGATQSAGTTAGSTPDVTEGMFLQLLVAQLENQDPTTPTDPTQFVTELAQFSELEQDISISGNTQTIATDVGQLAGAAAASSSSANSSGGAAASSSTGASSPGSAVATGSSASTQTQN
jgi:flagellar basal-body rod modification protein FlgD